MGTLLTFTWDFGKGLDFGFYTLRLYSVLFATGFVLGYLLMKRIFKKEGVSLDKLETLLVYVVVATIVGARLGHVFFYQWDYYSQHISEIFKIWEGGLASHGAAVAIVIAIIIYCKKVLKKPGLWMLDRLVIAVALAGALIRMGNWFNSEIYGAMSNSAFETVFTDPTRERILLYLGDNIESIDFENTGRVVETDTLVHPVYKMSFQLVGMDPANYKERAEHLINGRIKSYINNFDKEDKNLIFPSNSQLIWDLDKPNLVHIEVLGVPRHPTQIYEALGYFLIFLILYGMFQKANAGEKKGLIFGAFLILVFGFRFFHRIL